MSLGIHLRRIHSMMAQHGFNPLALAHAKRVPGFWRDLKTYRAAAGKTHPFPFSWKFLFPILNDKTDSAGVTTSHYFIQDLWMARKVVQANPQKHIDVGSRIDGFIAHLLAAGVPTTQVDIRPLPQPPQGLSFLQDDATTMRKSKTGSVASLSSLHAAEHFGLGRYGDPVDPNACFTFMQNLARVLKKGGKLYFSTPIGKQRVEFNAQRVFAPATILETFKAAGLKVVETSVITSKGKLVEGANPLRHADENFACGLFIFTK